MKKIGIVGGLGPEATIDYYRIIIHSSLEKMKGSTPEIIINSLDLRKFSNMMKAFDKAKDTADGCRIYGTGSHPNNRGIFKKEMALF